VKFSPPAKNSTTNPTSATRFTVKHVADVGFFLQEKRMKMNEVVLRMANDGKKVNRMF